MKINNLKINKKAFKPDTEYRLVKKGLKGFIYTLSTLTILGGVYGYRIHKKIDAIDYNEGNLKKIVDHYEKNEEVLILALNDSQGINLNPCFWENSFPEHIEEALEEEGLNTTLINAASLKFNKTYHIDLLLKENLTVEEMKVLNKKGAYAAFEKISKDINIPINLGPLSTLITDKVNIGDSETHLADELEQTEEPIVIYFSGSNDIMREIMASPLSLKNSTDQEKINYSISKAQDPETLKRIMANVENNFQTILSINNESKIVAISTYMPGLDQAENLAPFETLVSDFNKELKKLCDEYGAIYVSNESIGKAYSDGNKINFHINEVGQKKAASETINSLAENLNKEAEIDVKEENTRSNNGLDGMISNLIASQKEVKLEENNQSSIEQLRKVRARIIEEFDEEINITKETKAELETKQKK